MRGKSINRWNIQVVFPKSFTLGSESRRDVEQTPESVAEACEDFAKQIREVLASKAQQETP